MDRAPREQPGPDEPDDRTHLPDRSGVWVRRENGWQEPSEEHRLILGGGGLLLAVLVMVLAVLAVVRMAGIG